MTPGGPGLGAVRSGAGIAQLFSTFGQTREILLINQRGTGGSNRLACEQDKNESTLLSDLETMSVAEMRACRDELARRADLSQYETWAPVLDIETLRSALGYGFVRHVLRDARFSNICGFTRTGRGRLSSALRRHRP